MTDTLSRADIIARVRGHLGKEAAAAIAEDANLFSGGLLESLQTVTLVVFLEETFACSFDYDDLTEDNLKSLSAIADLVLRRKQAAGHAG